MTGGIGSGKSTATNYIKELGFTVIDADKISHEMTLIGEPGYAGIVSYFGNKILNPDRSINRSLLGNIVFNNINELKVLESLITENVVKNIIDKIDKYRISNGEKLQDNLLFIDAPLLFETGLNQYCDSVWIIDLSLELRIKRVMKRDNLTEKMVRQRIANQISDEKKKALADVIIDNSKDVSDLLNTVERLLKC